MKMIRYRLINSPIDKILEEESLMTHRTLAESTKIVEILTKAREVGNQKNLSVLVKSNKTMSITSFNTFLNKILE